MKSAGRGFWEGWEEDEDKGWAQALTRAHEDGAAGSERGVGAMVDALKTLGVSIEEAAVRIAPLVGGGRVALALLHPDQGEVVEVSMGVVEAWLEGFGARASEVASEVSADEEGVDEGGADEEGADEEIGEGEVEAGALLKLTLALLGALEREMERDALRVSAALWREVADSRGLRARDDADAEEATGEVGEERVVEAMRRALWCGALAEARTLWRGAEASAGGAMYVQAGGLYERMGDWERARGMYAQALKAMEAGGRSAGEGGAGGAGGASVEAVRAAGLAGVGRAKAGVGDVEGAWRALEMAFQAGYAHPRDAVQLAWLLLGAGKLAEAERWRQTADELGARAAWLGALDEGIAAEALARAWACVQSGRGSEAEACLALAKQYAAESARAHLWSCEAALAVASRRVQSTQDALLESLCEPRAAAFGRRLVDWLLRAALDDEVAEASRAAGWLQIATDAIAQLPDVMPGDALLPWQMALIAAERLLEGDADTAHMAASAGVQLLLGAESNAPEALRADATHLWLLQAEAARRVDDHPRAATMLLHALRFCRPDSPLAAASFLKLAPCLRDHDLEAWLDALAERLSPEALTDFQSALDPPPSLRIPRALPQTQQPPDSLGAHLSARLQPLGVHLSADALSPVVEDLLDALDLCRAEGLSASEITRLLAARLRRRQNPAATRAPSASTSTFVASLPSSSGQPLHTLDPAQTLPWQRTQSARASDAITAKTKRPK